MLAQQVFEISRHDVSNAQELCNLSISVLKTAMKRIHLESKSLNDPITLLDDFHEIAVRLRRALHQLATLLQPNSELSTAGTFLFQLLLAERQHQPIENQTWVSSNISR
eukprot:m.162515 g.162515  ORF g.162515 m.162515 type:complete len:109 (-) comp53062_c0_seq20:1816-2142(-)